MREIEDDDEGRGRRRLPVGRLPYGFLPQGGFFSRIGKRDVTSKLDLEAVVRLGVPVLQYANLIFLP
jgi:hypothetical protein